MRSDRLRKGNHAAPQRAILKALGLSDEEISRPLIGIVNSQNDIVPGHMMLDKVTEAAKIGVAMAGGTPIVFPAIALPPTTRENRQSITPLICAGMVYQ